MRSRIGGSGRRWTGGRFARLAASLLVAGFLGWWAVKVAVVDAMARANPFLAARVAPDHPASAFELGILEMMLRNGRIAPADRDRAVHALGRAALADEPFLISALGAAADGQAARSEAFLVEARRRNPRDRMVRLLLLDRYLRTGRSAEAGTELSVILRLIPVASGALVPQMTQLAADPKTRAGLSQVLARNPELRDGVLARLATTGADTDLILALASESGSGRNPADPPEWQRRLLGRMVEKGEIARAHQVWQGWLGGGGPAGAGQAVYDGAFRGLPGAPPFNWELVSSSDGTAERSSAPALEVTYYGRARTLLARQMLLLAPGAYRLQFRAEGSAKGDGPRLQWSVGCAGAAAPLVEVALKDIASAPRTLAAGFAVPAGGCAAQWLRLDGIAGDVASEQDARISDVRVTALGGGSAR